MEQLLHIGSSTPALAAEVETTTPTIESAPPAPPEPTTQSERETLASPRLAAIAAKERAFLQKRLQQKKFEADLRAREAQVKRYEDLRAQAKLNPLKTIEDLGINYSELTNFVLNGNKPTPELELGAVKSEIEQLKAEQKRRDEMRVRQEVESAKRAEAETMQEFRGNISHYVDSNADQFKLIKAYGGEALIEDAIKTHYENTLRQGQPRIMDIKEAAPYVEEYLREELMKGYGLLNPTPVKEGGSHPQAQLRPSSKTINNEMLSSSPSILPPHTENDRLRRALAKLGN